MKYIFNILFIAGTLLVSGQQQPDKTLANPKDFRPYDLKFGINIVRAGQTWIGSSKDTQEFEAALALYKYNVILDYGRETNQRGGNYSYLNKGGYYRIGVDRNFINDRKSGNVLSLGLRYARASFEDEIKYTTNVGFGDQDISLGNPNLKARWLELVVNLRARLVSNLYSGFTLRWQFSNNISGEGSLSTFDVPGFGTTKHTNSTKFDYYLAWRIPFDKKQKAPGQ